MGEVNVKKGIKGFVAVSVEERFFGRFKKNDKSGCWEWTSQKNRGGYGTIYYNGRNNMAHRFSYEHFKGPIPKGHFICHKCDTPACVNPEHLFAGTNLENIMDAVKKERQYRKLNNEQVLEMRRLHKQGIKQITLSKQFGVSFQQVSRIVKGEKWKHLLDVTKIKAAGE